MFTLQGKDNHANILIYYLKSLGIKFTYWFTNKHYQEHPHKQNMYGISKMLSAYKIPNVGVKINDKNDLFSLDTPFMAQVANDFALVKKITPKKVHYMWKGKEIENSIAQFNEQWTGVVLIAEADSNSIEPNYEKNKIRESYYFVLKVLFILSTIILGVLVCLGNQISFSLGRLLLLIVNVAGLYISYLLVLKQINIHNQYTDKICSFLKNGDCNDVLESTAAKLFGLIGWSEIGFGYFTSNLLLVLFAPHLIPYLAFINILALPYTLWSVWYQKYKAKQWCPLCLLTQVSIWLIFTINLSFGYVSIPHFSIGEIASVSCTYLIPFLTISLLLPTLISGNRSRAATYELNSLKMNDDLFNILLKKQPYYSVDAAISHIMFGNPNAKIRITVLTNPHCNPCAMMHNRIEKLLDEQGDSFSVQYIFTSFSEELGSSAKTLISIYKNNEIKFAQNAFNEWFKEGMISKNAFFSKYTQHILDVNVEEEYQKHKEWQRANKLAATPTVLVNGYELPNSYKIEDVVNFTDLDI